MMQRKVVLLVTMPLLVWASCWALAADAGVATPRSDGTAAEAAHAHTPAQSTTPQHPAVSDDYVIEISNEGPNLWHLKLRNRLLKMSIVEKEGNKYVKLAPVDDNGRPKPYATETILSLEVNPTTTEAHSIPLRNEGEYLIAGEPIDQTEGFNAAIHMTEKDHQHRRRFRFPAIQ